MKEKVFNLFLYIDEGIITQIGVTMHKINGNDNDKLDFLKNAAVDGFINNVKFLVPTNFKVFAYGRTMQGVKYDVYMRMYLMGAHTELFQEIFDHYDTAGSPLISVTHIINGVISEYEEDKLRSEIHVLA